MSKTAAHEWPSVTCRAIDTAATVGADELVSRIYYELTHAGPAEVGISASGEIQTLTLNTEAVPDGCGNLNLSPDDVVIISGGGRGVTAEIAYQLASKSQPTLLLLGRSPLPQAEESWLEKAQSEAEIKQAIIAHADTKLSPKEVNAQCGKILNNRELRHNIARLEQAGSQVLYHAVDIRDEAGVGAAIESARQHGAIRGIIHGAGALADKSIADKTAEQFDLVYSTKIAGLQALMQATAADTLNFIALFSSSTARFGRTGQIDYAAANEVLNKTAQALARQLPDCRVLALNWGPWDGGMVNAGLKKLFASEGIDVIDLEVGSKYLLRELDGPCNDVELVLLGDTGPKSLEDTPAERCALLPDTVLELPISTENMPFLRDHVINSKAVVPMAMSAEWLALGALHNHPGLIFRGFDQLRICKGITLENDAICNVALRCGRMEPSDADEPGYTLPMQICAAEAEQIYSSAAIRLGDAGAAIQVQKQTLEELQQLEDKDSVYANGPLFHGSSLQSVAAVGGINAQGMKGVCLNNATPETWMQAPLRHGWITAPMALDCAFQLMILWCFDQYQRCSLPSYIGSYRQYVEHMPTGRIFISIRVNSVKNAVVSADIDFISEATAELVAGIKDYECTMADNLEQVFAHNQLG